MKETFSPKEADTDKIDLSLFFAALWKRRKLIVFGTIGATLLSILISLFIPRVYLSEGFYQLGSVKTTITKDAASIGFPRYKRSPQDFYKENTASIGVPITLYKSTSPWFYNPNQFQLIAGLDKSLDEESLKQIKEKFRTATDINRWVKPVYAHAKDDAREFVQMSKDETNSVIAMNLAYEADSPEKANSYVRFFATYIRDCFLYVTLYNYVIDGYSKSVSEMNKNENDIIDTRFQLQQNANKLRDIRAILSNYPQSEKIENRQLVSVQEGGSRFLAPITQLVGIESALADLRRISAELERDKEILAIRAEYFSRCNDELAKIAKHGESLFLQLKSIKDEVFKDKDSSKDTVKEVFNNLTTDMQVFEVAFFKNCHFVSGPTIPGAHIKPRRSLIVMVTCFVSFFLLVLLTLALHWWQRNKRMIMSVPSL
jgi:LPS O-antigen subunit length determinant protein (WzzB/FepE family)